MASKKTGLSGVYRAATSSVTTVFDSLNVLASAGHQLACNAEAQAMISRVESSAALLNAAGQGDAVQKISDASALMEALRNM